MKKLTKCSVVLGRFQPFHTGHLSLIKIMNDILPPDEVLGKITRMTIRNKHKIEPMPSFIYVPDEEIADWIRSR